MIPDTRILVIERPVLIKCHTKSDIADWRRQAKIAAHHPGVECDLPGMGCKKLLLHSRLLLSDRMGNKKTSRQFVKSFTSVYPASAVCRRVLPQVLCPAAFS